MTLDDDIRARLHRLQAEETERRTRLQASDAAYYGALKQEELQKLAVRNWVRSTAIQVIGSYRRAGIGGVPLSVRWTTDKARPRILRTNQMVWPVKSASRFSGYRYEKPEYEKIHLWSDRDGHLFDSANVDLDNMGKRQGRPDRRWQPTLQDAEVTTDYLLAFFIESSAGGSLAEPRVSPDSVAKFLGSITQEVIQGAVVSFAASYLHRFGRIEG